MSESFIREPFLPWRSSAVIIWAPASRARSVGTEFMDIVLHDFERNGQPIAAEQFQLSASGFKPAADTPGSHRLGWDSRFEGGASTLNHSGRHDCDDRQHLESRVDQSGYDYRG